jgi:protein-S-isoprenylcysteine O-methyltransferase Ste14
MTVLGSLVIVIGVIGWVLPFFLTGWSASAPQRLDRRARWGLGLEIAAYVLMLQGGLWATTPSRWRMLASVGCFVLANVLSWTSTRALGKRHLRFDAAIGANHELVQRGPYHLVRHPIYSSMLCILVGIGLMTAPPLLFVAATAVFLAGTEIRVRVEDSLLAARFGDEFRRYRRSTRAYVPLLR